MSIGCVSVEESQGQPHVHLRANVDIGEAGLALPLSAFEAGSLLLQIEGVYSSRPLTHDLLADIFTEAGMSLDRAEFYAGPDAEAQARLVYDKNHTRRMKDVRPSDALALALRLHAPIYAERSLLSRPAVRQRSGGLRRPAL